MDFTQYKESYEATLLERWQNKAVELDVNALRGLLYGVTFTADYAEGHFPDALSMDYWRDRCFDDEDTDCMPEPDFGDMDDLDNINPDDIDMYEVDTPQEHLLMEILDSTGDGKTPETAICVIDVGQEYEYLKRKFPFSCLHIQKQIQSDGIDCLYFKENMFGIDCIYFDMRRRFEVGYPGSNNLEK